MELIAQGREDIEILALGIFLMAGEVRQPALDSAACYRLSALEAQAGIIAGQRAAGRRRGSGRVAGSQLPHRLVRVERSEFLPEHPSSARTETTERDYRSDFLLNVAGCAHGVRILRQVHARP